MPQGHKVHWAHWIPPSPFDGAPTPQGTIATAMYCRYRPSLILGATYGGQVLAWDTRQGPIRPPAQSHGIRQRDGEGGRPAGGCPDPVLRSPLSADAHTFPVFGLQLVGTPNAHNVVSLRSEGNGKRQLALGLCLWSAFVCVTEKGT